MKEKPDPRDTEKKARRILDGSHFMDWQELENGLAPFGVPHFNPAMEALLQDNEAQKLSDIAKLITDEINFTLT